MALKVVMQYKVPAQPFPSSPVDSLSWTLSTGTIQQPPPPSAAACPVEAEVAGSAPAACSLLLSPAFPHALSDHTSASILKVNLSNKEISTIYISIYTTLPYLLQDFEFSLEEYGAKLD